MLYILPVLLAILQSENDYKFVPYVKGVTFHINHVMCEGIIDTDGSFLPNLKSLQRGLSAKLQKEEVFIDGSWPPPFRDDLRVNSKLYEFRSGKLIPMIVDQELGLIPEVGGIIIDFKDYRYSPTARRIYNLPGFFVRKQDAPMKKP